MHANLFQRVSCLVGPLIALCAHADVTINRGTAQFGVDIGCSEFLNRPPADLTRNVLYDEANLVNQRSGSTSNWHGWGSVSWAVSGGSVGHLMASGNSHEGSNGVPCSLKGGGTGWLYARGHGEVTVTFSLDTVYKYSSTATGHVTGVPHGIGYVGPGTFTISGTTVGDQERFSFDISLEPPPIGRCCLNNGLCSQLTEPDCNVIGGCYQGDHLECLGGCQPCTHTLCFRVEVPETLLDTGHGFVVLIPSSGSQVNMPQSRGLYPDSNAPIGDILLPGSGSLGNDSQTRWEWQICYPIDTVTYHTLAHQLNHDAITPPYYNIVSHNCMTYLQELAIIAGVQIPPTNGVANVPNPRTFAAQLESIGNGNSFHGGVVSSNSSPPQRLNPSDAFDWAYSDLILLGFDEPAQLAAHNNWPYSNQDSGPVDVETLQELTIVVNNRPSPLGVVAVSWGDGSAAEYQALEFTHQYDQAGQVVITLIAITNGGLLRHQVLLNVLDAAVDPFKVVIDIPRLPPVGVPNRIPVIGSPIDPLEIPCDADTTKDGYVNVDDLLSVINSWGQCQSVGLVAYYPFNGNANDQSGAGRHGTVFGAVPTADRFGQPNAAYQFDGVDDFIRASATGLPTQDRTLAFWFYASTAANPVFLGYGGGDCGTSVLTALGNGSYYLTSHCGINTLAYTYSGTPAGEWVHFAATTAANGTRLYVNGAEVAGNAAYVNNTFVLNKDLALGVAVNSSGYAPYTDVNVSYLSGKLDEVRIYDRALSPTEIEHVDSLPTSCPADIDLNGVVAVDDLLAVINAWGACP